MPDGCRNCERCTWNPGPDCGVVEHGHCERCGHCRRRHVHMWMAQEQGWRVGMWDDPRGLMVTAYPAQDFTAPAGRADESGENG